MATIHHVEFEIGKNWRGKLAVIGSLMIGTQRYEAWVRLPPDRELHEINRQIFQARCLRYARKEVARLRYCRQHHQRPGPIPFVETFPGGVTGALLV